MASISDPVTIEIAFTSRKKMAGDPQKKGPWSYHHVFPVRIYFAMASTFLHVAAHPACPEAALALLRKRLTGMCDYAENKKDILRFIDGLRSGDDDSAAIPARAKVCGNPPYGMFQGPDPDQRSDDPRRKNAPEMRRPVSHSIEWWTALHAAAMRFRKMFALDALPGPEAVLRRTRTLDDWLRDCETLAIHLSVAEAAGMPRFAFSDWRLQDGRLWSVHRTGTIPAGGEVLPQVRVRSAVEPISYCDLEDGQGRAKLKNHPSPQYLRRRKNRLCRCSPPDIS